MKIEDQVVSLELAKEMKELGFEQDSLWYWQQRLSKFDPVVVSRENLSLSAYVKFYSAYTVAELGEMLPPIYINPYSYTYNPYSARYETEWEVWYATSFERAKQTDIMNFYADTEANAKAKMLIYLKKENLL